MSEEHAQYNAVGVPQTAEAFRNRNCTLPGFDPNYSSPTPEDVTALIRLAGWSQSQVARLAGVNYNPKKGSTTVRKWRTPVTSAEHRDIPYAAWRLLLCYAGIVDPAEDPERLANQAATARVADA